MGHLIQMILGLVRRFRNRNNIPDHIVEEWVREVIMKDAR